jgi:hypothetical protein
MHFQSYCLHSIPFGPMIRMGGNQNFERKVLSPESQITALGQRMSTQFTRYVLYEYLSVKHSPILNTCTVKHKSTSEENEMKMRVDFSKFFLLKHMRCTWLFLNLFLFLKWCSKNLRKKFRHDTMTIRSEIRLKGQCLEMVVEVSPWSSSSGLN